MADFLQSIRRRRAKLIKELEELNVAERVYREMNAGRQGGLSFLDAEAAIEAALGPEPPIGDPPLNMPRGLVPKTIQQMILQLLDEAYPSGLTSLELLSQIQKRWKPELQRTSLSPQLSRLRASESVTNDKGKWYLAVKETGAPDDSNAPV